MNKVTILNPPKEFRGPDGVLTVSAEPGENLFRLLRRAGAAPESYCGGTGRCGKCTVRVDGREVLACETTVDRDLTVELPLPESYTESAMTLCGGYQRPAAEGPAAERFLAFDIGTTTLVGYLLDEAGRTLAVRGELNPQIPYGADVVSRIRSAREEGTAEAQTDSIRRAAGELGLALCRETGADPAAVTRISVVGNPTMQQLFLGLPLENLVKIPFRPLITAPVDEAAAAYLPAFPNARLLSLPDVSAYVGADTAAGVLATGLFRDETLSLLVDIGTNGEMVLGDRRRMVACATAAGPALEGGHVSRGMRASAGAIDKVSPEGEFRLIPDENGRVPEKARGICGSGLIDALAYFLKTEKMNPRGRIANARDRAEGLPLRDGLFLTQTDIRELQQAKGAIAAGIRLLADTLGVGLEQIGRVWLAGAFGSHLDPASACAIGLLPPVLRDRIVPCGNAAGEGACLIAADPDKLLLAADAVRRTELLELNTHPGFPMAYARGMLFPSPASAPDSDEDPFA